MRALDNPPNPFSSQTLEWDGPPPPAELQVYEQHAKSIVARNNSPDLGLRCSVNPYRGCFHACAYCYARPTHQYLDMGAGTDFDRRIVVKVNAPQLLRDEFMRKRWVGEPIMFSGNTDCYQPLEAHYLLTRRCLEVCAEFKNPVRIITKSKLIRRDVDIIAKLAREAKSRVAISIPFADREDARKIEPFASPPDKRFETMRILHEAGVPVTVAVAPVIPAINDMQIPEILERAKACGADEAFMVLVRLPLEVRPVFEQRVREAYPLRADKVLSQLRGARGGQVYTARFGDRMRGRGARWQLIEQLFHQHCQRLGLDTRGSTTDDGTVDGVVASVDSIEDTTFERPRKQLALF